MTCPYCQSDCTDSSKFCPNCGAPLEQKNEPVKIVPPTQISQLSLKCPKCWNQLNVDTSQPTAICPICNFHFDIKKAIKANKWAETGEKMQAIGSSMQKTGNAMSGCGCLMTIFITIPIIILLMFIFK